MSVASVQPVMTDRLRAAGQAACRRRGYAVSTPEKPWLPAVVADPTPDSDPFVPRATTEQVAVEPLVADELTPTLLLSRLRNNQRNDRFSLFVVDDGAAEAAHTVLARPPLVADEDELGRRTFYNGPDRIRLAGGGYAAVRTDSDPERLVWREVGDGDEQSLLLLDGAATDATDDASALRPTDDPVLAWLDGVDDLSCPAASAFPYSYRRDAADKRFRLRDRSGDVVGVYDGVSDFRANAYLPVPMPLVPEHVFAGVASVRDEWAILAVDDDSTGRTSGGGSTTPSEDVDRSLRLVTADG
jgi:hypothetical protein